MDQTLLNRFYGPLLLLHALGQTRGEPFKQRAITETGDNDKTKHQRSFADGLAYIFSYKRDPAFVTAVVLERTERFVRIWAAANENIRDQAINFVQTLLQRIHRVARVDDEGARSTLSRHECSQATQEVLEFSKERIMTYYQQISTLCKESCYKFIQEGIEGINNLDAPATKGSLGDLKNWLENNFQNREETLSRDLSALVEESYHLRINLFFEPLKHVQGRDPACQKELERLFKLLCKFCKHITVTRKLFEATVVLFEDFRIGFQVKTVRSAGEKKIPLPLRKATISSIIGIMLSKDEQDSYKNRLALLNTDKLAECLQESNKGTTKVHAELLLINLFDQQGCNFLGGSDKYIGCSKPACYLCHEFISNHPNGYKVSGSHQNLYIKWRLPDLQNGSPGWADRKEVQHNILLKLIEKVRQDLQTETASQASMRPYHPDSTTGVTTETGSHNNIGQVGHWLETLSITESTQGATSIIPGGEIVGDESEDDEEGVPISSYNVYN